MIYSLIFAFSYGVRDTWTMQWSLLNPRKIKENDFSLRTHHTLKVYPVCVCVYVPFCYRNVNLWFHVQQAFNLLLFLLLLPACIVEKEIEAE